MELVAYVQILDSALCISLHINALRKGMNLEWTRQSIKEKKNSEFKLALLT